VALSEVDMAKSKKREIGSEPNTFLYKVIGCGIAVTLSRLVFAMKIRRDKTVVDMPGPLVCIGNHPSYLDPIIMAALLNGRKINFVAGAFIFRNRFIGPLFIAGGCIPKQQFQSDSRAVKGMLLALKRGGTLGIFPEATRLIDGTSIWFDDALARMIIKTGSAVAIMRSHGAYMTWPRWTKSGIRRGRITAEISNVLSSEQVKAMSVESLHAYLLKSLEYNEYEWFKDHPRPFKNRAIAAGAHNIAHACPRCGRDNVMTYEKNMLICTNCGNCAVMSKTGFFSPGNSDDVVFEDLHQWVNWEKDRMAEAILDPSFNIETEVTLLKPFDEHSFRQVGKGNLMVRDGKVEYFGSECDISEGLPVKKNRIDENLESAGDIRKYEHTHKIFPVEQLRGIKIGYGKMIELVESGGRINRFILKEGQRTFEIQTAIQTMKDRISGSSL